MEKIEWNTNLKNFLVNTMSDKTLDLNALHERIHNCCTKCNKSNKKQKVICNAKTRPLH